MSAQPRPRLDTGQALPNNAVCGSATTDRWWEVLLSRNG
jgi:hypothetical protein